MTQLQFQKESFATSNDTFATLNDTFATLNDTFWSVAAYLMFASHFLTHLKNLSCERGVYGLA